MKPASHLLKLRSSRVLMDRGVHCGWLPVPVFLICMVVFNLGVALAADYQYRFEGVQVSEGDPIAKLVFEITRVTVDGVPAAGTEVQDGDYIHLRFRAESGSAIFGGDFNFDTGGVSYLDVVLYPGERKANVVIDIIDDGQVEPDESFRVRFEADGLFDSLSGNSSSVATTIIDNDLAVTFLADGNGTVNGQTSLVQILTIGDSTTAVTPQPNDTPLQYRFDHWVVSDGVKSIDVFYPGMVIGDVRSHLTITAIFVPVQHEVVIKAGTGGSLNGGQMQITQFVDDRSACQVISAIADPGYRFESWNLVAGTGNGIVSDVNLAELTITEVTGPLTVEALFSRVRYTIDVTVNSPSGPSFSQSSVSIEPLQDTYDYGETVTLTAIPGTGTRFRDWSGPDAVNLTVDETVSMTITADVILSANFDKLPVTLRMKIAGTGAGSTLPEGSDTGLAHPYTWGDTVQLSATPEITSEFAGWSSNVENGVVEMIGDQTVIADFKRRILTVTVSAGSHGILKDSADQLSDQFILSVPYGDDTPPINAKPDPHYLFDGWFNGDALVDPSNPIYLENVTTNVNLTARFVIETFTVSFHGAGQGVVVDDDGILHEDVCVQTVAYGGSTEAVTAVPAEERIFEGWFLNGSLYSESETIVVSDVTGDMQFTLNGRADILGCALPVNCPFVSGFNAEDFDLIDVAVDENNHLVLQTGLSAIDPNRIVIPFTQDVYVTFLYEGAGFKKTDFGWIAPAQVAWPDRLQSDTSYLDSVKHQIYEDINDNDKDGILDNQTDRNEDGRIDRHDNKVWIGQWAGGEEIVFYLDSRDSSPEENCDWCGGLFFTKREWNERHDRCTESEGISRLVRLYENASEGDTSCYSYVENCADGVHTQGWLDATARNRLKNDFGFNFRAPGPNDPATFNTECVDDGRAYPENSENPLDGLATHAIIGAPDETPFAWVLGIDDTTMDDPDESNDYDYNDVVFLIERKTGGMAQLTSPLYPQEEHAFYTAVEFEVYDHHPGGECAGKTQLLYYLSVDGGQHWLQITEWDEVFNYTLNEDGSKTMGSAITPASQWTPGQPADTFRKVRIDFAGRGLTGRRMQWKVEMISAHETCIPKVIGALMNGETASHDSFSRATPVVQANVIFSGFYQTPAPTWPEMGYRGRLTASLVYDPRDPDQSLGTATVDYPGSPEQASGQDQNPDTTNAADPSSGSGGRILWDAGEVLAAANPDDRRIFFPDITLYRVYGEHLKDEEGNLLFGDGQRRTFSGKLGHRPVSATTLRISSAAEYFSDHHTDDLKGSLNGSGSINRFTGRWEVTFTYPPLSNEPIRADYAYYSTSRVLKEFLPDRVNRATLALTDEFIHPAGYTFDVNSDGQMSEADSDWLVEWVRGYRQPNVGQKKSWLLGPIDHSVPAVLTPPGKPEWVYVGDVDAEELNRYNVFFSEHAERPTVVFVGARDGMLHAFDVGKFRHGDNPDTDGIKENRGYFLWEEKTAESPAYCDSFQDKCPNYGSGREIWAFIPANLLPRLKNNCLLRDDQAYVDASPALADVYIDTDQDGRSDTWRTVLLAAEGNGGDTVFCLDVTDPYNPAFLWEFAAPELFRSRSSPAVSRIGRIRDPQTNESKWVAFFVSGKIGGENQDAYPAIYMLDVSNGSVLRRILLDTWVDLDSNNAITDRERFYGRGGLLSGQPAVVDSDFNGFIDRIYVASNRGFLYRVDLPDDPDQGVHEIDYTVVNTDYTAARSSEAGEDTVPESQRWHPIYGSPAIVREVGLDENGEIVSQIRIFFGTGDSPYYDENIDTANTTYHFFAYVDTAAKHELDPDKCYLDWFVALPAGNRVFASAFAAAEVIYFGTSTAETEDPCEGHGQVEGNQGRIYAFDLQGNQRLNKIVGDIRTTPLVEDEHLYFRTPVGLHSLGSGFYNTPMRSISLPEVRVRLWREID